jgi:RecA/RadA recombinase
MIKPLNALFELNHQVMHLYGLPGTYKTTFLTQIIRRNLEEECEHVYLIDTSGNFPIVRLKPIKHLLKKMIVFHPKSLEEEVHLLDDLSIKTLDKNSVLLIDDIFRHINLEENSNNHLNSYLLAQVASISQIIKFPVVVTNQARSYDNHIRPFLQSLTLFYWDWHLFFEKSKKNDSITISLFKKDKYVSHANYMISKQGLLVDK